MKKFTSLIIIALLIVAALTVSFSLNQTKIMKGLVVNNDLEMYGVILVPSTGSDFNSELITYLKNNQKDLSFYSDAVKPFAFFVKNTSAKDVVGISLRWEIQNADGSSQIFPQVESAPNQLMGFKSRNLVTRGSLIPSNTSRFFAWDADIQSLLRDESQNLASDRSSTLKYQRLEQLKKSIPKLRNKTQKIMNQAVNISVSIDGIFFNDGTFIGVDQNYLFATMRASIQAQKDFIKEIREAVKAKKNTKIIFDWLESLASKRPIAPDRFNNETEKYNYRYEVTLYYSAKQALNKRRKYADNEIIKQIANLQTDDSIVLRKEGL